MSCQKLIRVLVVDDSAIVRRVLKETLNAEPDIEVVGCAPDPYVAREKVLALKPDVLTLDIEMPRMDGLTFLKKLMRYQPLPVVIVSSVSASSCETAMEAMRYGAVEVLAKPAGPHSLGDLRLVLASKIRAAAQARLSGPSSLSASETAAPVRAGSPLRYHPGTVIAIGASTGGTKALELIFRRLPAGAPGVVAVQHIPSGFSRAFAKRLNRVCEVEVREAVTGDSLAPGQVLMAPGDSHMLLQKSGGSYRISIKNGPRVCYQRPSVDVLFRSVAASAGKQAIGVILTGMGSDGADGLLRMKQAGADTIAQDEESCIVFGMPKEAIRLGAANRVLPLQRIPEGVLASAARMTEEHCGALRQ